MNQTLGRLKRWLLASPERTPRRDAVACTRIGECALRQRVEVGGTITATGVNLTTGWFEAELSDPSGCVRLIWMGRKSMDCLYPGATVTARGRLARLGEDLALYNPEFSVLPT
ncbi:hypothetical protein [Tessaracoccus sp. OH4464_COT-324]|uniref:hypothetical protein n=1 Tax=Tessaracoccus sp. OH4464_COT-324 TaxID=2491059 RepID=UPI000F636955|nr:hypothetical protein [Tessaracoccus sp. OH4464_COT-324]RRD47398.1 hypothetical protein EII42_02050 [Tessaracoccus sp. OH4464_COT-324]